MEMHSGADGRIISTVKSVINQPPSTPLTEAKFHIDYTRVDTFQIPSRIAVDIKNTGSVVITLNTCRVATSESAKKP